MGHQPWWRGAVVYQIWPRSFADANGDGIGDLTGVIDRLDYLNDGAGGGLGIDAIWLSPVYPSPGVDFGYDVADYTDIDPIFGSLTEFDQLVREAHQRGVRVILDWVPNHTSDQHPWFQEARSSVRSRRRDWYVWRNPSVGGGPPNNWVSAFSRVGPAWTLDAVTRQYYLHSYTRNQPDLNWDNPAVEEAMTEVLRFWLERGVDGVRIDVVHRLGKDPLLRDNPPDALTPEPEGPGRHDADWPSLHDRLRRLRQVADSYGDRLLVGEVYILDQARVAAYVAGDDQIHLAHNFVWMTQPWSASSLGGTALAFEELIDPNAEPAWFFNNHDHPRIASRFDEAGLGSSRARAAAVLLLGLRGTIFIYQGEELGLPDIDLAPELRMDIDGRDPVRAPIPWEAPSVAGPGAGFSTVSPWLPVGTVAEDLNIASQQRDPSSTLWLYRNLIRERSRSEAMRGGSYRQLWRDDDLLVFERATQAEAIIVAVNFTPRPRQLPQEVLSGWPIETVVSTHTTDGTRELQPLEARWLRRRG